MMVNVVPEGDDSWIFHVPNACAVPAMAEAMGKELVTGTTDGTEGGDIVALREVLSGLDVDGVVSGAIWSDYQWDRMGAVCDDLGLRLFAPLWRKDQDMLLDLMVDSGIRAVIVGCYAEGFDESWLGRPIDAACVKDLRALRDRYGVSVMGEGGEYESMVLDAPMFRHPLEIKECDKVWKRDRGTLFVRSIGPEERVPSVRFFYRRYGMCQYRHVPYPPTAYVTQSFSCLHSSSS